MVTPSAGTSSRRGSNILRKGLAFLSRSLRKISKTVRTGITDSSVLTEPVPAIDVFRMERLAGNRSTLGCLLRGDASDTRLPDSTSVFGSRAPLVPGYDQWHSDFFSGHTYPMVSSDLIPLPDNTGADCIVPWELSRMQILQQLAGVFLNSGCDEAPLLFNRIIGSWETSNPYGIGVNWRAPMEVGVRAVSILLASSALWSQLTWETRKGIEALLWRHIQRINETVLEKGLSKRHNHHMVACASLLACSSVFSGERARGMRLKAAHELSSGVLEQFRRDGGHFESSTSYHGLVLESVLLAVLVERGTGRSELLSLLDGEHLTRLARAVEVARACISVLGHSPGFGDSDDGRLLVRGDLFSRDPLDPSPVLSLWSFAFPDESEPGGAIPTGGNILFPDSGWAFFAGKEWGAALCAAPVDGVVGGHSHLDKLSVVLSVDNKPLLVDSGTFCYTHSLADRKRFKGTRGHNTLMVDGLEQAEVDWNRTFSIPQGINPRMQVEEGVGCFRISMSHDGYSRLEDIGELTRSVEPNSNGFTVTDSVNGSGQHNLEIIYNLAPGVVPEHDGDCIRISRGGFTAAVIIPPKGFSTNVEETSWSGAYRESTPSLRLVLTARKELPTTVVHRISVPAGNRGEKP